MIRLVVSEENSLDIYLTARVVVSYSRYMVTVMGM